MNLFVNYFDHKDKRRSAEIDFCKQKNRENKFIENIIIVKENERATFADFFNEMANYPKQVNIIANADIYFDETIELAKDINEKQCYALTRHELYGGIIITFQERHGRRIPTQWSQDAWIFKGAPIGRYFERVVAVNSISKRSEEIQFFIGVPGCDNKLAVLLKYRGYDVTNPSHDIRAIHVHETDERNYPHFQILQGIRPNGLVYQTRL